jgi:hypothetical protein
MISAALAANSGSLLSHEDLRLAVVDVDTLRRSHEGADFHWLGRACKVYTKIDDGWLLIMQTGLLLYGTGE